MGHIQYEHLLQLFYSITRNEKKKTVHGRKKDNSTNVFATSLEP